MSISLGVGAEVGVPAALPHDGDPIVPPGEEVVKPSNTLRNFFIFFSLLPDVLPWAVPISLRTERRKTTLFSLCSQSSRSPLACKIPTR